MYGDEDVEGALQSLQDEIPKPRGRHRRAVAVFTERGVEDLADTERCVELLRDERLRAEFHVKLKQFLASLDLALPAQSVLRHWIVQFLDEHDVIKPFERLVAVADRLVELAKANHQRLVR